MNEQWWAWQESKETSDTGWEIQHMVLSVVQCYQKIKQCSNYEIILMNAKYTLFFEDILILDVK